MAKLSKDKKRLVLDGVELWYDEYHDRLQLSIFDKSLEKPLKMSVPSGRDTETRLRYLLEWKDLPTGYQGDQTLSEDAIKAWTESMQAALPGRHKAHLVGSHRTDFSADRRAAVTTWIYASEGSTWTDYSRFADDLKDELRKRDHQVESLVVVPRGNLHPETGNEIVGTVGTYGFRIWEVTKMPRWNSHNNLAREAYDRIKVIPALHAVLGRSDVQMVSTSNFTKPDSPSQLVNICMRGDVSPLLEDPALRRQLRRLLDVSYLAVSEQTIGLRTIEEGTHFLLFGDVPTKEMRFINPTAISRRTLEMAVSDVELQDN